MYYLTEILLIFLFIALAGSFTVDFAGYFDFNRKWTYSYQLMMTATDISKSNVRNQVEVTMTETNKEISNDKNENELQKTTHKTRFSVTGQVKKVTTEHPATKNIIRQKKLETTTSSEEKLETNIGDVTESILTSPSIDHDVKKPVVSGKIRMEFDDDATTKKKMNHKGLQQDITTVSDENLEINNQKHITKNTLTSPSTGRGVKKPSVTSQIKKSLVEGDIATEKIKHLKPLQLDLTFSDENLEINSQSQPSIGRVIKKLLVTGHISGSLEENDTTTEKKKRQKDLQHDLKIFSDENFGINSEEHITVSVLTSPSSGRGVKKPAVTNQMGKSSEEFDTTTEKKKRQKDLQHDLKIFSDENFGINSEEHITVSVLTSPSSGRGVKKPAVTNQMGKSSEEFDITTEKKKRQKDLQINLKIFSDENLEINSEEHITESFLKSPSSGHGVKKPAVTNQMSRSSEEFDTTTEKKKRQKDLQINLKIFSDENLEINSEEHITESFLKSSSSGHGVKKPAVTNQMSRSSEEFDTTTEKKKHQKDLQQDLKIFSDEIFEINSQEHITESISALPSIGRSTKKTAATSQMSRSLEEYDTATEKKKGHKGLRHETTTLSDEILDINSEEHITDSVLKSPSIDDSVKKPAATSKIRMSLKKADATIKKKEHHKESTTTTASDEYADQEYANDSDLKSPSKDKKSATYGITNMNFEDETTTKKKTRYKKPEKPNKKIVYEQSSDSRLDSDEYSLEDENSTPKKKQAKSKQPDSSERNLDTTTENIFNSMRPQYYLKGKSNISLHTIEEDPQVKHFIAHVFRSALKIFSNVKNNIKSPTLVAKLDLLAEKYVTRFNAFIAEIKKNKIKTALGKQKVLLSAIDSSHHMMNRIVNYIVEDRSNKDPLRTSVDVANEFRQAVNKETDEKYIHICRTMKVCHAKRGFANFLNAYITIILLCDDSKFAEAVRSFTEVTKKINFIGTFDTAARLNIVRAMKYIESQDLRVQKTILMIIRNIVANKNEPIKILKTDRAINSTLALWEILDAFETKLLRSDANIIIWGDLRTNLVEWAKHKRNDIHDTMNNFMFYLKTALDDMPSSIKKRIGHNIGVIMNRKPGM